MSYLSDGVEFDFLGQGWLYALESTTTPGDPGIFTSNGEFPKDNTGNDFATEVEYKLFAKRPGYYDDPYVYRFIIHEDESITIKNPPVNSTGGGNGTGSRTFLQLARESNTMGEMGASKSEIGYQLDELESLDAERPITLKGTLANYTRQVPRGSGTFAGLTINADDNFDVLGQLGRFGGGSIGMLGLLNRLLLMQGDGTLLMNVYAVLAEATDFRLQNIVRSQLSPAVKFEGAITAEVQSDGRRKDVFASVAQIAAEVEKILQSAPTNSNIIRQTRAVGCDTVTKPPQVAQGFTLTTGHFTGAQAHNLQVSGDQIIWSLRTPTGAPAGNEITVSYPDKGHYQLSTVGDVTPTDLAGYRLALTYSPIDGGEAQGYAGAGTYTAVIRGIVNPDTDDLLTNPYGKPYLYASPVEWAERQGFDPDEFEVTKWQSYNKKDVEDLSDECLLTGNPDPETGGPTWQLSTIEGNTAIANVGYDKILSWDLYGAPFSGKTLIGIDHGTFPPWLSYAIDGVTRQVHVFTAPGVVVPAGITSFAIPLILNQNDGKNTPRTFTITVTAASVIAHAIYNIGLTGKPLDIYVGADGDGVPTVQLAQAPAAYGNRDAYIMTRITPLALAGKTYYFKYSYAEPVSGFYVAKILWLGQTKYASISLVAEKNANKPLTLADTAAEIVADHGLEPGEVEMEVLNRPPYVAAPFGDQNLTQSSSAQTIAYNGDMVFSDPDIILGDHLEYSARKTSGDPLPAGVYLDPSAGAIVLPPNFEGILPFLVEARDLGGLIARNGFLIIVSAPSGPVNAAPQVTNPVADMVMLRKFGERVIAYDVDYVFSDPNGDTLTPSATKGDGTALPAGFSFNFGAKQFIVPSMFLGEIEVKVTVTDGSLTASDTFRFESTRSAGIKKVYRRYTADSQLKYWVRGETADGGNYWPEYRLKVDAGAWGTWTNLAQDAGDGITAGLINNTPNFNGDGDFYANVGPSGTATQIEFRLRNNTTGDAQLGQTYPDQAILHYDFTIPSGPTATETLLNLS